MAFYRCWINLDHQLRSDPGNAPKRGLNNNARTGSIPKTVSGAQLGPLYATIGEWATVEKKGGLLAYILEHKYHNNCCCSGLLLRDELYRVPHHTVRFAQLFSTNLLSAQGARCDKCTIELTYGPVHLVWWGKCA